MKNNLNFLIPLALTTSLSGASPFYCSDTAGENRMLGNINAEANVTLLTIQKLGNDFRRAEVVSVDVIDNKLKIEGKYTRPDLPDEPVNFVGVNATRIDANQTTYTGVMTARAGEAVAEPVNVECTLVQEKSN